MRRKALVMAFALGYAGSVLGTLSIQAIAHDRGWWATGLELATTAAGIMGWHLWKTQHQSTVVMVLEAVGAVLGTRVTMWMGL